MEDQANDGFAKFRKNGFIPCPGESIEVQFARLAQHMNWPPGSKCYLKNRKKLTLSGSVSQLDLINSYFTSDGLKIAVAAYNHDIQQRKNGRKLHEPSSWFGNFREEGFKHDLNGKFEDEFVRLAKFLKCSESKVKCTLLADEACNYYAGYEEYPKLNTLSGYMIPENAFQYDPLNGFDVEFARLAKQASIPKGSEGYRKRHLAAKLRDEKIRSVDLTKLPMFKHYAARFKLNPNSDIDVQYWRLIEHLQWGEIKSERRWRSLLDEALLLADQASGQRLPMSATSGNSTKVYTPSISTQSHTSGVKLTAQSLSGHQTTDFTPTHSEYTPAPTTSSYFSSFAGRGFTPEPSEPLEDEFDRLSIHEGWAPGNPERIKQWRLALESELEAQFGASDKLASWQALCTELGIDPPPTSITQCKKAIKTKHVSIKSLVNARREMIRQGKMEIMDIGVQLPSFITTRTMAQMAVVPRTTVKVFDTVKELRKYCKKHKMFFSKVDAKEDGFLKALLRHLTR